MCFFKFLSVLMLTVLLFHFSVGSNDAIAPDFPAQVLGTRDDDLADTVNIKHKEGIYSKSAVTKASLSMGKKPFQKDNAGDWSGFVYFVAFFHVTFVNSPWNKYSQTHFGKTSINETSGR